MTVGNISLQGHDFAERYKGKLMINTGDSTLNFIATSNPQFNCNQIQNSHINNIGACNQCKQMKDPVRF